MIITRLQGGLGNQMFQYALGRTLSIKHQTVLLLDTNGYGENSFRAYGLDPFNIQARKAALEEIYLVKPKGIHLLFDALKPNSQKGLIKEKGFNFQLEVLMVGDNTYIESSVKGGWQSPKYFIEIADIIRNEFQLKDKGDPTMEELLLKIESVNSTSIHIRLTDYLAPKHQSIYDQIGLTYYREAIQTIGETELFIFSDDVEWVKANLKTEMPVTYVSDKGLTDQQELFLMSQCKNNITANSTYSWWGAWLNRDPNKVVITPRKWFVDGRNEEDLIPPTWIKL